MKMITPYLTFDGNAREAMTFYKDCLGAELTIQTFGDVNAPQKEMHDKVMHAHLSKDSAVMMASDAMPGMPYIAGNNVWIAQECDSVDELEKAFTALSAGGTVVMPVADQFWGARFGMLTDKYGMNWMLNCELKKS